MGEIIYLRQPPIQNGHGLPQIYHRVARLASVFEAAYGRLPTIEEVKAFEGVGSVSGARRIMSKLVERRLISSSGAK